MVCLVSVGSAPRSILLESHIDLQNHWQNWLNWEMSHVFQQRFSLSLWFGNYLSTLTKLCFLIPLNCFSQTCLSVLFPDLFICINSIMSSLPSFKEKFTLSGVMIHFKKKMSQSLYGLFWPRIYNQTYISKCGLGANSMESPGSSLETQNPNCPQA